MTIAWIVLLGALSQVAFRRIWAGTSSFPYDASTTFPYWNVARLEGLRDGDALLGFLHVGVPFEVWPSYYFSGIIRQLAALVQPNTPAAHAILQALHGALLVPAVALLLRSFGVPLRYGAIGGLVYVLAGIHASVTQHVYSYEALVYLVLSLWTMREFALGMSTRSRKATAALFFGCGLVLVSLVRVHHEAIIYMPPMLVWAIYHLWLSNSQGRAALRQVAIGFAALALFVAICSIPMLMVTYDLSVTNKTQPHTYETLAPYFGDPRVLGLAFALPEFAGELSGPPSPYNFGTDPTLAYVFAGTLSAALYVTTLLLRVRDGRWKEAVMLVILPVVLLSYTFGPGNFLHRGITFVFPFLVGIGHGFFGLHLFYLLVAFGVAEGIRQLASGRGWLLFLALQAALYALVLYVSLRAIAQAGYGWGLDGSLNGFAASIQDDTRYAALTGLAAAAILGVSFLLGRIAPAEFRARARSAIILLGFAALVTIDMVRPLLGSRFLPAPLGDVPAEQIAGYVESALRKFPPEARQRALVIGGWRANALLPLGVELLQMPGDSGGNKYVTEYAALPPSEALITTFIEQYGATLFWAERGFDDWHEALAASPQLRHGFHAEWGGDVYWVKNPVAKPAGLAASWNSPDVAIEDHLVRRTWQFPVIQQTGKVSLPLLWHPGYGVRTQDGRALDYDIDEYGRVRVELDKPTAISVAYPNRALATLVLMSGLAYLAWFLAFAVIALQLVRDSIRRGRSAEPVAGT